MLPHAWRSILGAPCSQVSPAPVHLSFTCTLLSTEGHCFDARNMQVARALLDQQSGVPKKGLPGVQRAAKVARWSYGTWKRGGSRASASRMRRP